MCRHGRGQPFRQPATAACCSSACALALLCVCDSNLVRVRQRDVGPSGRVAARQGKPCGMRLAGAVLRAARRGCEAHLRESAMAADCCVHPCSTSASRLTPPPSAREGFCNGRGSCGAAASFTRAGLCVCVCSLMGKWHDQSQPLLLCVVWLLGNASWLERDKARIEWG